MTDSLASWPFCSRTVLPRRRCAPGARIGAEGIAVLLLRQGRTHELLELHAGFGRPPAGPDALAEARSLHTVEYCVLLVPEMPLNVLDEAARRVQWAAAKYLLKEMKDPVDRAALKHSAAVARLRQGRFAEVERLCAPTLAVDVGPDNRATVLATIVLARRALGQPHSDLLAEAVALSPESDLVPEARRNQSRLESQPEPFAMH